MQVWLNGRFCAADKAFIPATDRGFLLGDAFFETMRAHKGKVAWLDAHMSRLHRHAERIAFPVDLLPKTEQVEEIIAKLSEPIQIKDAVVRLTVSRGTGDRGLLPPSAPAPTILITLSPFEPADPTDGIKLSTSQKVRRNPYSTAGNIKSTNYLDNIVAKQEAHENGAQDAVILSADGQVAETSIANLFGIAEDSLWTPAEDTGILGGLARAHILQWAKESGIKIMHDPKTPDELCEFEVLFTANALQGLRIVKKVDGYAIGNPDRTFFTKLAQMVEINLCNSIEF